MFLVAMYIELAYTAFIELGVLMIFSVESYPESENSVEKYIRVEG